MRPGMAWLLGILRGEPICSTIDDAEWNAMLVLAEEQHVAAWMADCVRKRCSSLTQERLGQLDQIERASAIAAFYWSCELKNLLGAFARHAIPAVLLKGPFLAERLYGSTGLRGCRDLDLLVGSADLLRAETVLRDCGFAPGDADDYHRAWSRCGATVELHFDVENPLALDFAVAGALQRAQTANFQGEICSQLAPEDELLYLCLHAARHRYERLSLLVDLQLAFEKLVYAAQPWAARAEVRGLNGVMALGLAMVRRLEPGFESEIAIDVSLRHRAHLEEVANGLWQELTNHARVPLDWRAVHAFYMQMEEPGWPRVKRWGKHMQILSGRVIAADFDFAAGFGLHAAWHARLLRPVRLMSQAIAEYRSRD